MMEGKRIADSRVTLNRVMGPQHANAFGNVHGGVIMKEADEAAAVVAMRHAQAPTVTVAIDSMTFMHPIHIGDLVQFNAELTYVGRTSMEVRVDVLRENLLTGATLVTNTAYLVYVALDTQGKPKHVPSIIFETEDERKRAELAKERQTFRKQQRAKEESL